jgi:hypothetical protein
MFQRTGLAEFIGADKFFWSADQAIIHASQHADLESRPSENVQIADISDMPMGVVPLN